MEYILYEKKDNIAIITINRPDVLNALNVQGLKELKSALETAGADTDIRCVILTAAGERAFCAGGDIKHEDTMNPADALEFSGFGQGVVRTVFDLRVPVIIAARGHSVGAGMEMMLAADYVVAGSDISISMPTVKLGYVPGFGCSVLLTHQVGHKKAKEILYSGRKIKAEEALELGLVQKVVEPALVMEEALALAEAYAGSAPLSIERIKQLVNFAEFHGDEAFAFESEMFSASFGTEDRREATAAFMEKRQPAPFKRK